MFCARTALSSLNAVYSALNNDVEPPAWVRRIACSSATLSLVKVWRIWAWLSKSIIWATSLGVRRRGAGRRFLRDGELAVHAGAAVEQDRQRDRQRIFREVGHGLEDAVLVDLEVLLRVR